MSLWLIFKKSDILISILLFEFIRLFFGRFYFNGARRRGLRIGRYGRFDQRFGSGGDVMSGADFIFGLIIKISFIDNG